MDEGPAQTPACGRENGEAGEEQQDGAKEGDLPPLRSLGWGETRQAGTLDGGHRGHARVPQNMAYNPTQGKVQSRLGRTWTAFLMPSGLGEPMGYHNVHQISPQGAQRKCLGGKGGCVSLASQGGGESQSPWPASRPNHLLHDGPNEAAAQNNGGHHQQVEVDQVEVLSEGRGLRVTRAPSPYIGFSYTHYLPRPSPLHRDCPRSLTFIGLQLTQDRKLPRGVEQDPERGSGTVPGDERVVCEHSRSNTVSLALNLFFCPGFFPPLKHSYIPKTHLSDKI